MYVGESMLLNEVVYLRCLLQIYAPTFLIMTLSAKKSFSFWGLRPKDPYQMLYFLHIL